MMESNCSMCRWACVRKQAGYAIRFVPEHILRSTDLVKVAIAKDGRQLEWLKDNLPDLITDEICTAAVNSCGYAVKYVPEECVNADLATLAVMRDGKAFYSLPKQFQTKELVSKISIKYLPDELKEYKHCMGECIKQGRMLQYVPLHLIDEKMIEAALVRNSWALEFVPIQFKELDCVISVLEQEPELPALLLQQAVQNFGGLVLLC